MIGLEDRRSMAQNIEQAHRDGARLEAACELAGISERTLQRWKAQQGLQTGDGRPQALRPTPDHALTPEERQRLLEVANEPRFADMPPARIVPALADEGVYLASESSFSRVLREAGQSCHRGRAKAPRKSRPPTTHVATGACQGSCRLIHAARGCLLSSGRQPAGVAGSRSGLSVTTSMRCQLRVCRDQRRGLLSRAWW
jgi:putative transposase